MRVAMLRATATALMVVVVAAVGAAPARSRCLAADVILHWSGGGDQAVVTDGQCQVPTPFGAYLQADKGVRGPTPAGTPSGAYVEVVVPLP